MYTQPLAEAIAEAERLVTEASFIESEADLLEGLQMEGAGLCAERRAAKVCQRGGPVQIDLLPASAAGQHGAQQREKYDSCKNSAIHDGFLL